MSDSRRLPARVYWVRRFVVLGIPLILVAVVVWFFVGRGSGPDDAAQGGTSPAPVDVTPSPTTTEGVGDCPAGSVALAMTADATSFAPGVPATFTVAVTNTGTEACLVDAGEAAREIV